MSFLGNNNQDRCPGNINGNPMNGLCERVCVQTTKIFDACMMQTTLDATITLTELTPEDPKDPLIYVSGNSTTNVGTIAALTVTPIQDKPGLSRVTTTVDIPVQINYTDANGTQGYGTGTVSVPLDVIMCVPTGSVITPTIAATVNLNSTDRKSVV